jgi:sec-independent protein translocase protein TatB
MFDIAPSEFLLIAIVAVVVIGPKDLPMALRTAGRWIARVRRVSNHFRSGIETMIREAEMEEMERKWKEQNAAIAAATPPVTEGAVIDGQAPHDALPAPEHPAPSAALPPVDPLIAAHAPTEPVAHEPVHTPQAHPEQPA